MYKLILEDELHNQIVFNELGGAFQITDIQGLNPPSADINTNDVALIDGQTFNSAKLQMRTINLAFAIDYEAERARMEVYRTVHSKKPIRLYYQSEYRDVYIDGYVQAVDISYFEMKQICTVSILCPQPYLKAAQEMIDEVTAVVPMFHFPFASTADPELVFSVFDATSHKLIENDSGIDTGMVIEWQAIFQVTNPKLYNFDTGEFIGLNMSLQKGDKVTISTAPGNKTVTLLRNGVESNIFNALMKGSTWLELRPGINDFYMEIRTGNLTNITTTIKYQLNYEGV